MGSVIKKGDPAVIQQLLDYFNGSPSKAGEAIGVSSGAIRGWLKNQPSMVGHIAAREFLRNRNRPVGEQHILIVALPHKHADTLCRIIKSVDGKYVRVPTL